MSARWLCQIVERVMWNRRMHLGLQRRIDQRLCIDIDHQRLRFFESFQMITKDLFKDRKTTNDKELYKNYLSTTFILASQ